MKTKKGRIYRKKNIFSDIAKETYKKLGIMGIPKIESAFRTKAENEEFLNPENLGPSAYAKHINKKLLKSFRDREIREAKYEIRERIMDMVDNEMDKILEHKLGRPLQNLMAGEKDVYNALKNIYTKILDTPLDRVNK